MNTMTHYGLPYFMIIMLCRQALVSAVIPAYVFLPFPGVRQRHYYRLYQQPYLL